MKKYLIFYLTFLSLITLSAQRQTGLMWEITGKGMTKPSYVYGTMHVSEKVAFHLGDPFFKALKSVDIVALEQNLDSVYVHWIENMFFNGESNSHGGFTLNSKSFEMNEYEKDDIATIMSMAPVLSNFVLFRTSADFKSFQEETYLDMLIYRLGKKYKKYVTGVEDFLEAERLTSLATAKDVRRKSAGSSYDLEETMAQFYRKGDITSIDSLNKVLYTDHYNEYMLYRRNKNMVHAMDSLMKKGSLFCGVGCAHLPGKEGVISLLEAMGYTVKPINTISNRPSKQLDKSKKIQVVTPLKPRTSPDGFFTASVPGEIVNMFRRDVNQTIYASLDLPAGAQYLVYRMQDYPYLRNSDNIKTLQRIDSILYEYTPGKIKGNQVNIIQNNPNYGTDAVGYDYYYTSPEGDMGHYRIMHTGSELVFISVTGMKKFAIGKEAEAFFSSFKLNNAGNKNDVLIVTPDKNISFYAPSDGKMPVTLNTSSPNNPEFDYTRHRNNMDYIVQYRNLISGLYLYADTAELLLTCESFAASNKLTEKSAYYQDFKKYPARYAVMEDKDKNTIYVRAILKGRKYFLQALKSNDKTPPFNNDFFSKVDLYSPSNNSSQFEYTDTFCHFTANVFDLPARNQQSQLFEAISEQKYLIQNNNWPAWQRQTWFAPQNENEYIEVNYRKYGRYEYIKDSATFWKTFTTDIGYTNLELLSQKSYKTEYGTRLDVTMGDTGCSRRVIASYILKGDEFYNVIGFYDTISGLSNYTKTVISSFKPYGPANNNNIFQPKVALWVEDINHADSSVKKKAWAGLDQLHIDSNSAKLLVAVYDTMRTSQKLVDRKRDLILNMGFSRAQSIIPTLARIYRNAGDTSAFQTAVIRSLAMLKSKQSYKVIKELILEETPVSDENYRFSLAETVKDTMELAATLYPELFDLINLEDYKTDIIELAAYLLDSNHLKSSVYESKVSTIASEANVVLKKILAKEASKNESNYSYDNDYNVLLAYAKVLLPYQSQKPVQNFLDKFKTVKKRDVRMENYIVLLKHGYNVEDSVFNNLASERKYKADLYNNLKEINRLDKFPSKYLSKSEYSRDAYYNLKNNNYGRNGSTEIDTINVVDSAVVVFYNWRKKAVDSGYVYLVKLNRKKKKNSWEEKEDYEEAEGDVGIDVKKQYYYAVTGPQPTHKDSFNGKYFMLVSDEEEEESPEYTQKQIFQKLIRKSQIDLIRPGFYGYGYGSPWSYDEE